MTTAGRHKMHDYDGDDFYLAMETLAMRGYYDREIADELHLSNAVFSTMKKGRYQGWTDEENKRRSERIQETLNKARNKTNALVRSTFLKVALGATKCTNVTRRYVEERCECAGQDPQCPYCGGTGKVMSTTKQIVMETETSYPPNLTALAQWLHHHDPEWVKAENGAVEETEAVIVGGDIKHGIDIDQWIGAQCMDKELSKKALSLHAEDAEEVTDTDTDTDKDNNPDGNPDGADNPDDGATTENTENTETDTQQ